MDNYDIATALIKKYGHIEQIRSIQRESQELIKELERPVPDRAKILDELADFLNTTAQAVLIAQEIVKVYNIKR